MIKVYQEVLQGSDEWYEMRRGLLTASEMKLIITPTLKVASNERERSHLFELMAQRITGYVEPSYIGDDMMRGWDEEIEARKLYSEKYAPVHEVGFITNDKFGFVIGCSPDGLVGDDGLIECKSRKQKYQAETILTGEVPEEYMIQLQTLLLVSERKWVDFISYCGGMPMFVKRVLPLQEYQLAIIDAAQKFEGRLALKMAEYKQNSANLFPTTRKVEQEVTV